MAIPDCGTFQYSVKPKMQKLGGDGWVGRATSLRDSSEHPGLAGARPHFRLSKGSISLRPTEFALSRWTNKHFREWPSTPSPLSLQVGDAMGLALQDEDVLHLARSGTGDLGVSLLRDEKLVLALGAVFLVPLGAELKLANDPRMQNPLQYEIAADLRRAETHVVWINSEEGDLASWKLKLESVPVGHHLMVVVREAGYALTNEIFRIAPEGWPRKSFHSVDFSIANEKAWRESLEPFAGGPPKDPYVSVWIRGNQIRLHEGQEEIFESYFLRLERYFWYYDIPGKDAILAIAQLSPKLPKDAVVRSLEPFLALGRMTIGGS